MVLWMPVVVYLQVLAIETLVDMAQSRPERQEELTRKVHHTLRSSTYPSHVRQLKPIIPISSHTLVPY